MMPPVKNKKIIIGTVCVIICVCLIVLIWHIKSSGRGKTTFEAPPLVRTMIIAKAFEGKQYLYAGDVRGRFESQLAFQVGGKIVARHVDVGSAVKQGQILMEIDARDIEQTVNNYSAQAAQAGAQLELSAKDLKRYRSLFEQDVVSRSQLDQIQCAYDVARARLDSANALLKNGRNQLGYTRLRADQTGVVTTINAEIGQVVGPGQVVVSVVHDGEKEIEISVPENRIDAIRVSHVAQVTFWALPGLTLSGKIREISPVADPALRTYKARVALLKPSDQIRLGMTASVKMMNPENRSEAPYIPLAALYQTGNTPQVWIVQNGAVRLQAVTTGRLDNNQVQVLSGLKNGDVIVLAGVHKLREGQKVNVMGRNL